MLIGPQPSLQLAQCKHEYRDRKGEIEARAGFSSGDNLSRLRIVGPQYRFQLRLCVDQFKLGEWRNTRKHVGRCPGQSYRRAGQDQDNRRESRQACIADKGSQFGFDVMHVVPAMFVIRENEHPEWRCALH